MRSRAAAMIVTGGLVVAMAGCGPAAVDLPAGFHAYESGEDLLHRVAAASDEAGSYRFEFDLRLGWRSLFTSSGSVRFTDTESEMEVTERERWDPSSRRMDETKMVFVNDVYYVYGLRPEWLWLEAVPATHGFSEEWVRIVPAAPDVSRRLCQALGDVGWYAYPELLLDPVLAATELRPVEVLEHPDGVWLTRYWAKLTVSDLIDHIGGTDWLLDLERVSGLTMTFLVDQDDRVWEVTVEGNWGGSDLVAKITYQSWGRTASIRPPRNAIELADSRWADVAWFPASDA